MCVCPHSNKTQCLIHECEIEYCRYCDDSRAVPTGGQYMPCICWFPCCLPCILLFDIINCPCYTMALYDSYKNPSQHESNTPYTI